MRMSQKGLALMRHPHFAYLPDVTHDSRDSIY